MKVWNIYNKTSILRIGITRDKQNETHKTDTKIYWGFRWNIAIDACAFDLFSFFRQNLRFFEARKIKIKNQKTNSKANLMIEQKEAMSNVR